MGILNMSLENDIKNVGISANQGLGDIKNALTKSRNLFNKVSRHLGYKLDASGNEVTSSTATDWVSDFIEINRNISTLVFIKSLTFVWQYDITRKPLTNAYESVTGGNTITLHKDAAYIKVYKTDPDGTIADKELVVYNGDFNTVVSKFHSDTEVRITEPFANPNEIKKYDINLHDATTDVFGIIGKYNNTTEPSNINVHTALIPISKGIYPTLKFLNHEASTALRRLNGVSWYDERHDFLGYSDSIDPNTDIEIPDNAKYMSVDAFCREAYYYKFKLVIKYGCFNISWADLKQWSGGDGYNLVLPEDNIKGIALTTEGVAPAVNADMNYDRITPFIPVKPNTRYVCSGNFISVTDAIAAFYDGNKNLLSTVSYTNNVLTTPSFCRYIVMNVQHSSLFNPYLIEASRWDTDFVEKNPISDTDDVAASYVSDTKIGGGLKILGVYHNFTAILSAHADKIIMSKDGWNGNCYEVEISGLPGMSGVTIDNETIKKVLFFLTNDGSQMTYTTKDSFNKHVRCLIFGSNNRIWSSCIAPAYSTSESYSVGDIVSRNNLNYKCTADTSGTWTESNWTEVPVAFSYFEIPNIWDLKGQKQWRIDASVQGNSIIGGDGTVRYKKYYPTDIANRKQQFLWHNGPIWTEGAGGQYARGVLFASYGDGMAADNTNACLFYTEDGKNIYVQYEMGIVSSYKKAGSETVIKRNNYANYGDEVDVTGFSGSIGSMTIRKRYSIIPCEAEKDPVKLFDYDSAINVSSFTGNTVTVGSSGLAVGDVVVLEGNSTGDFTKLLSSIDSTTGVADGPVFVVKTVSGNNITLADSIGNTRNNLFCRHIHGISEFGSGFVLYTGEEYPESWCIYINPYFDMIADGYNMNNNRWFNETVRLNASENGHQRSLGMYLRADGKVVFISDSNYPNVPKLSVRGIGINQGNYGVYLFDLADIDDASKSITKIANVNAGYALYPLGNILFYSDYHGKCYISKDLGDSWDFLCQNNTSNNDFIGFDDDNNFYFGDSKINQFVIHKK